MGDTRKIVWVLGAGFSAPLGGPLLKGLLSPESARDLAARYPRDKFPGLEAPQAGAARAVYRYGLRGETGREALWANAEEFMDYVDTAAQASEPETANPYAERLKTILYEVGAPGQVSPAHLRAAIRHLVAAECCGFLEGVGPSREQWQPFRTWASGLGSDDTVVTFNWDRVVEVLVDAHNRDADDGKLTSRSRVKVIRPGHVEGDMAGSGCPLLKLHGSVDWRLVSETPAMVEIKGARFAIDCPDGELAIGTPGPSKRQVTTSFVDLWTQAEEALKKANVVVFVGFRFPPTDADARSRLLSAIRSNESAKLSIHVVLGPVGHDSQRLEALLNFMRPPENFEWQASLAPALRTRRTFTVAAHPLFAEDFLTVFARERL